MSSPMPPAASRWARSGPLSPCRASVSTPTAIPSRFDTPFSVLKIKPGWTVGAGLEARLFGNVTGKVEYLYMDFGTVSASVTNALNATPITFSASSHVTDNIVRAGVNYKFDPAVGGYDVPPGIGVPPIYKAPAYGAPIAIAWIWAGPYLGINA